MSLKHEQVLKLFDEYESLRFDKPIRNYDVVHENVDFMNPLIQQWIKVYENTLSNLELLVFDSLKKREISPELESLYGGVIGMMEIAHTLGKEIVTPDIEAMRHEFHSAVLSSLSSLINYVFFAFHPNADYRHSESVIPLTVSSLALENARVQNIETNLKTFRHKKEPGSSNLEHLFNFVVSTRVQLFLLLSCFVMLLLLDLTGFSTDSRIVTTKVFARIFSVLVATLWFQGIFMMRWKRSQEMSIWVMVWATLINIWIYGIFVGAAISILLYAFPVRRLLGLFKDIDDRSVPDRFFRRFSLPYAVAWSVVALVLTHEIIWLIGLTVWISFNVIIRESSYRFFRQTYDLIENIFSEQGGRKQREAYFVASSSITAFVTLTGMLGHLNVGQIKDLLGFAGNFSLVLITILLAIQAVIPGINLWSSDAGPRRRSREIHTMLRANRGLGGFMVSFFLLFVLSNSTRWILESFDAVDIRIASLDIQFLTRETGSTIDVFLGSQYSAEVTLMIGFTIVLVVCVSLLIYCVLLLYYMFSTASVFLMPMLDSLLSTPVHVDSVSNGLSMDIEEKDDFQTEVLKSLKSSSKLNGCIIDQLVLSDSIEPSGNAILAVHYILDFPDKSQMYRVFKETVRLFYGRSSKIDKQIESILVSCYRDTRDQGKHNIFAVQVNLSDWRFFEREVPGMSDQYKIEHIFGAKLVDYVLPEAQVF